MKRRTALTLLGGAGLAGMVGCIDLTSDTPGHGSSNTPAEEDLERRVSISHQDTVPEEYNLHIEASIEESMVTKNHPARVQVGLTNDGSTCWIHVGSRCPLFWKYDWESSPTGVLLPYYIDPGYDVTSGPQWVITPPEDPNFGDAACARHKFERGGSLRTEYSVYDDGRVDGYLQPRTYTFSDDVQFWPRSDGETDNDDPIVFYWEMALTIESPN